MSDIIGRAIEEVNRRSAIIAELKDKSNYYPQIYKKEYPYHNPFTDSTVETYLSTLVRIERNGKWYIVHCVESTIIDKIDNLYQRLMWSVHNIQNMFRLVYDKGELKLCEVDKLQISEQDRLLEIYKEMKK